MRSVKYVPSLCKGEDKIFDGSVEIRLPTFDEKFEYFESLGADVDESGSVDKLSNTSKIKKIRSLVGVSKPHYLAVDLKKLSSGEEFKSFDDLTTEPDAHPILIEVATHLLSGFDLGKR